MAYELWKRLKKATRAGAPELFPSADRGVSPQMQSNLDKQAAQVRFQGTRRMQGRPGITNMGMFPTGGTLPLTAPQAAGYVSGKLQTPYASELNRMTAPDPMTFARHARAPELIGQEVGLGAAGVKSAEQEAEQEAIRTGVLPEQLQQGIGVGELGLRTGEQELTEAEAQEAQRVLLRPEELEQAQQVTERGKYDISVLPSPEEARTERQTTQELLRATGEQGLNEQRLAAMSEDIAALEAQGDYDSANRIRQQRDALLGGRMGPPAPGGAPVPGVGGAPPARTGASPQAIEINAQKATSTGTAMGVLGENGALKVLEEIADELGFPGRNTVANMEVALESIRNALATVSNTGAPPTPRGILVTKIKTSKGYRALKQRLGTGFQRAARGHTLTIGAVPRFLTGNIRPQDMAETQQLAQEIVDVVEQGSTTIGVPPI